VTPLAFLDIGFLELLVCSVVALLLFGGSLPEAMGRFGAAYRKFRRSLDDLKRTIDVPTPSRSNAPYRPSPSVSISSGVGEPPAPTATAPARANAPSPAPPPTTSPATPGDESPPV
jgi:Sec-independent protein translocase protein TatA